MKRFTVIFVSTLLFITAFSQQDKYSKVKILIGENGIQQLAQAGFDVTEGIYKKGAFLISDFSENELIKIQDIGLDYEILIDDVIKYYHKRNQGLSTNVEDYKDAGDYEVPENFSFGSMSGHATYDEIVAHLDNMFNLYPELITQKESIGQSIEDRELWMVKLSDNPEVNEDEPEVLYTALHHAREPASVMQMIFYLYYLLENYESDDFIKTLVDNTEMYFVPVVNPDGYIYNELTNPNGGGMWRKNRRNNGGGAYGVDPNRNYGYQWGYDNNGSSPDPFDATYRGTDPFSEPETTAMKDFCEDHEFRIALNYHTYSNLLLYPWGWTEVPCEDDEILEAYSVLMTQDNQYTYGAGSTTIYPTNGGSDDWMYGEQTTKNKILAYTPELGGSNDDFWCPIDRIIPIAQENMIQNILAAALSGKYAHVDDLSSTIISETTGNIEFEITRLGLMDDATFTVSLEPLSSEILSVGEPVEFTDLDIMESEVGSFVYSLDPDIVNGTFLGFVLSVDNGSYVISDTLTKMFGEATVLFEDDCNGISNWSSSAWAVTTSNYHSPSGSITDSPYGDYSDNQTNIITLDEEINLENGVYAVLNFWGQWEIEQGWDYVQLLISTNNGSSWTPLEGNYTVTGNEYQAEGEPVYDGFQTSWIQEEIELTDFIGENVKFRFLLQSDEYVTEDGFYFDDFTVSVIEESVTTGKEDFDISDQNIYISSPYPNPAKETIRFNYNLSGSNEKIFLNVYNSTGQKVYTNPLDDLQKLVVIPVGDWMPGIYYYIVEGINMPLKAEKFTIIR